MTVEDGSNSAAKKTSTTVVANRLLASASSMLHAAADAAGLSRHGPASSQQVHSGGQSLVDVTDPASSAPALTTRRPRRTPRRHRLTSPERAVAETSVASVSA